MRKRDRIKIKSLQPGFLVVRVPRRRFSHDEVQITPSKWAELVSRGFYGGLIITNGTDITSLKDDELSRMGLQRIPRGT